MALAPAVSESAAPRPMWRVFTPGSWAMVSSQNGHATTFSVRPLRQWACWRGDLIDLVTVKPAPEDYWLPGGDAIGHQIMRHDRDGSWRMVGTIAQSPDPAGSWTMQIHRYPHRPMPYVIAPGRRQASDTETMYYGLFRRSIVNSCMPGGDAVAPGWAREVYWRSRFRFDRRGWLHAHYEENHGCGPVACQMEDWTFARNRSGLERIVITRGVPTVLTLTRH